MKDISEGYSIHVGSDGRLQAWYQGKPLIPGMWWDACEMQYVLEECLNDEANRAATNLEATKQKYLELYQTGQSDYLRQALNSLNLGVYSLQVFVCDLLRAIERYMQDIQEHTEGDREVDRWLLAMNERILAIVVSILQDLHVDIPRSQNWLD